MKSIHMFVIALIVALAVSLPLLLAVAEAPSYSVTRIASEPAPTPTLVGSPGPCHGTGC